MKKILWMVLILCLVIFSGCTTKSTNIENTTVTEEYDEKRDVMFLNGNVDKVLATNKNFIIFYPEDAHMPALSVTTPQKVKKAIFKILK